MARPRRSRSASERGIGAAFVSRRHQLHLTQAELADLAGVSRTSVQAIETGRTGVRLGVVDAIADALGCDLVLTARGGR